MCKTVDKRQALENLAAALKAARAALPETVASRFGGHADALTLDRLSGLLSDCLRAVQSHRPEVGLRPAAIAELSLDELGAFRSFVYDTLDETCPWLASSAARLLADWFTALTALVTSQQQQRREEALRHSEQRFRLAVDGSTVVAFETDLEGRFTWTYNSKIPQRVGGDMIGRRIDDLMTAEESAALAETRRRAAATGARSVVEFPLYIGGERFHRLYSFQLLRDAHGKAIGFAGSGIDTTALKRAQAELSRAVAFREQLMAILGHDLRNPVSAVRGIAGLLQLNETLPVKVHEGLTRIDQAGRRMSEMIETILDFTRIQIHQNLPVSRSDMDFGELCRDVVDEVLAGHSGREVALDLSGDLRGHWDYARLAQVVSNLLGNALTHGDPKAAVQLTARGERGFVLLKVVNRGPTIAPEQMATLFEPFVRGAAAGNREQSCGLGLGLFIARQIVASHGGSLVAQSHDGTTRFTVSLAQSGAMA